MNILDMRTVFIGFSISNAICAIVMASLWSQNRRRFPALSFWLTSFIMQFLAVLLVGLRGLIPDFISIVVANILAVAGIILLYIGLQRFANQRSSQFHNYALLIVVFLIHTYFTYVQPNLSARNHNYSIAVILVSLQIVWFAFHRVDAEFRKHTSRIGYIFVLFGLINLARFYLGRYSPGTNDLFQSGLFDTLIILSFQMLYIGLTFILFLLINRSLVGELEHDIAERKKAEQALLENYSTLRNIMESTSALIFSVNRQYCYTSFNNAHLVKMKQLYSQDIRLGGNLLDYITVDEDRTRTKRNIDRAMAGEYLIEETSSSGTGHAPRFFEVTHAPILTDKSKTIGVCIFSTDITERKRMELSLQQRLLELETVNKLSISLRAGQNLQELLSILLKETLQAVAAADGCILLLDTEGSTLQRAACRGWLDAVPDLCFHASKGIVGHVFTANESHVSLNLQSDLLQPNQDLNLIPSQCSGALLPVCGDRGPIGMLIVSFPLPRFISENELRLLTIIAQLAANAISRCRLNDQIRQFNTDLQKEIQQKIIAQELLAAEKELLSTTLMSIADGVIATDKNGRVILFNPAAETITGYTVSEALNEPVQCVLRLHDTGTREPVSDVIEYLLKLESAQEKGVNYRVPQIMTKTGDRILASGSITPLKSAEENAAGFVIVFQNINEKQKADAQKMLSQKMEAIGQLAAGIAHEINTPIQYIGDNVKFIGKAFSKYSETLTTYKQMIQDRLEKTITRADWDQLETQASYKKATYYLTEIPNAIQESLDGIERVRKIVLAMREFSHPSEKEKKFSDINHGIETTTVISRNEWKYCAELELKLDEELPLVYCQIDEINQVILNMIVNAAQAIQEKIPSGSEQKGKITIRTRKCEDNVFITVQDTGAGIPAEIRARIFDPFFTTKGVGKGTGQGLSMAHNIIVKKHHGTIAVDSEPGQSTTFTIQLPVDVSELEQQR